MEEQKTVEEVKPANYQVCADLEVNDVYSQLVAEGKDALALIFNMQKSIQENVYGYDFDEVRSTIGNLKAYIDFNEEALRDESREFAQALTGVDSYPNCWKPWKSKHKEAMARPFSALTDSELKELRMEWIDGLHFFTSIGIAIGLTPDMITNYYVSKNAENVRRQFKPGGY